jgi:integrase
MATTIVAQHGHWVLNLRALQRVRLLIAVLAAGFGDHPRGDSKQRKDVAGWRVPLFCRRAVSADVQLLASLKRDTDWLLPIARLAVKTGMRRGELLALRWSAVDFQKRLIHVRESLEETRANREAGGRGSAVEFKAPKSGGERSRNSGVRTSNRGASCLPGCLCAGSATVRQRADG